MMQNNLTTKIVYLVHGPNLNLLGERETGIYGSSSLSEINASLLDLASSQSVTLKVYQSNSESELINFIQAMQRDNSFLIINLAGYTHTSIALRDAILAVAVPFVEVHISNIYKRESFRWNSLFSDIAVGVIVGLGPMGYQLAFNYALNYMQKELK